MNFAMDLFNIKGPAQTTGINPGINTDKSNSAGGANNINIGELLKGDNNQVMGKNLFNDMDGSGNMDTVSFTTNSNKAEQQANSTQNGKNTKNETNTQNAKNKQNTMQAAQKQGMNKNQGINFADNTGNENGIKGADNQNAQNSSFGTFKPQNAGINLGSGNQEEIKEIAKELNCEADEDTVKNQLANMSAEDLAKLNGNTLDLAEKAGVISEDDIEKKVGVNSNNANKNQGMSTSSFPQFGLTRSMNLQATNPNEKSQNNTSNNQEQEKYKKFAINFGGLSGTSV